MLAYIYEYISSNPKILTLALFFTSAILLFTWHYFDKIPAILVVAIV